MVCWESDPVLLLLVLVVDRDNLERVGVFLLGLHRMVYIGLLMTKVDGRESVVWLRGGK